MEPYTLQFHRGGDNSPTAKLYYGQDCRESLKQLSEKSVHMVATSPPYWGLRDYSNKSTTWGGEPNCDHEWGEEGRPHHPGQVEQTKWKDVNAAGAGGRAGSGHFCQQCGAWLGQLGLEPTPELFIDHLVEIFREVKRVLRDDGTLWLNLGDSYVGGGGYSPNSPSNLAGSLSSGGAGSAGAKTVRPNRQSGGLKAKDLVGIPWMAAFALRADGWYLRSDIIWSKNSCMPEAVQDRPTKSHEYVFLLTKSPRYFYDIDAIREPFALPGPQEKSVVDPRVTIDGYSEGSGRGDGGRHLNGVGFLSSSGRRNKRTVWTINPQPYQGAHFAVWPQDLVEPMIKAGSSERGCCSKCGAPYERVVETSGGRDWTQDEMVSKGIPGERSKGGSNKRGQSKTPLNDTKVRDFKGWQPTCGCDPAGAELSHCVVLDPFSGSATTGLVAMNLGRDYIGLDANSGYLELAKARLQERPAPAMQEPSDETSILDIFGS